MRNTLINRCLIAFLLILGMTNCYSSNNIWRDFNNNPNDENYERCLTQIEETNTIPINDKTPIFKQLIIDQEIRNLFKLVESGNKLASDLCFNLFPVFKGHVQYIEFFNISLGKLITRDAQLFMELLAKYDNVIVGKYTSFDGLLGNYGNDFDDNVNMMIVETNKRLESLRNLNNCNNKQLIKKCIDYFNKRLEFLKRW